MNELASYVAGRIRSAKVIAAPFPHVEIEDLVPPDLVAGLRESFPPTDQFGPFGKFRNHFFLAGSSSMLELLSPPVRAFWSRIRDELSSPEIRRALEVHFGKLLEAERFPAGLPILEPVPILVRDFPGYAIRAHTDVFSKVFTVQIYLPADSSRPEIGTSFLEPISEDPKAPEDFREVRRAQFLPGAGYAFPVHARSWHRVGALAPGPPRESLMVLFYVRGLGESSK